MTEMPGFFEIDRIKSDIPAEDFQRRFFQPEVPAIIEGAGRDWPALRRWSIPYLRETLSGKPGVNSIGLFLSLDSELLADDFAFPECMAGLGDSPDIFPYKRNARIWTNTQGNVSAWHFDNGVVNNFNAQIVGRKEWTLVSPQTPLDCYPFSNFVIVEEDEKILRNKRYTRFITEPGDILYLPPLWYHTVKSLETTNINIMWVFTKRKTNAISPALVRDERRYMMHRYLSGHRFSLVRKMYAKLVSSIPGFLRINWHFDQLIETGISHSRLSLLAWYLGEWAMTGKTILSLRKGLKKLRSADKALKLH